METSLNSGSAQVSDRFRARLDEPVQDRSGRTLLQRDTLIEGFVASVKRAKWGHRSGELGLAFNSVVLANGSRIPLRATLVGGDNPVDEEGDLKAKSSGKRDVLVTSGGAAAGAGVGVFTGATILGGGAGAAAGLTAILIMKGKNVDVDRGERFDLQLVQPLSPRRWTVTAVPRRIIGYQGPNYDDTIRTQWSRVPVYDAHAERDRDGLLRVVVTAQTSTTGWRIYTNYEVRPRDTLDVRLLGIPPAQYGTRRIDHPSAPAVCVEDRNSEIRNIVIHGSNGAKYLTIGQGTTSARIDSNSRTPYYPPVSQATPTPRPRISGSGGPYDEFFPPESSNSNVTGSLRPMAQQAANHIEVVRAIYGGGIGLWINNGTPESLGPRRTTQNERQLFDSLSSLLNSARSLESTSTDSYGRRRIGQQLQSEIQSTRRRWDIVRSTGVISSDLDRQWQTAYNELRALSDAALR
ncbi:MAG: hypothetical protein J2P21_11665 [Chloracidobacterium sp.]|nr:hypothetical protein [Chloracidobacterium sp.]